MFNRRTLLKASAALIATPALASQTFVKQRTCKNITTGFPTLDKYIGEIPKGSLISFTSKNIDDAIALQKSIAINVSKQHKTAYVCHEKLIRNGLPYEIDIIPEYSSVYDYLNEIIDLPRKFIIHYLRKKSIQSQENNNIYSFVSKNLITMYYASYIFNIDDNEIKVTKNRFGRTGESFKVKYDQCTCTYSEVS